MPADSGRLLSRAEIDALITESQAYKIISRFFRLRIMKNKEYYGII